MDELEFVVYLLFFELYLFVTSVGLVFSQGVPQSDKKDLSAPLATEPRAPSRRLTVLLREKVGLRPRTPKRSPLQKSYKRWAPPGDGRALAVDLWWFLLGFPFS